ncbi:restriction endonuclease subunit S [Pseudomonas sp. MH9.3]|uniref:restriction endonuclease subunit S n=1 Tax=Pseudomonas sp. MH9.3 TaxID=3048630 RepID=UPI002AC9A7B3|nr:restriction endonuclease subunit S [Pseudomonas sp. MH9.3]MEB0106043.1 restriction endonuclease subunit S [Pseudomonas sp. MH9.3]WPX78015.1 restriction endonuclease subunit S [Pseudomonas sp. MH9.3]WQG59336.1 restriction endonuclease subunit S [Pseudomonas sp. RTB3]
MNELPRGWVQAEIGQICDLINGRAFKPEEWSASGLPIIRIQNLNNAAAKFNYFQGDLSYNHMVEKGDLLFAWSGTPGTSFGAHIWHGGRAALNQHIFKIEFDGKAIERRFLRYAINQKLEELIGSAQGGVGLRHVTKGTFEKTLVSFPPSKEQVKVAEKIDDLLAQVDTLKARFESITQLLKRFRQSILFTAVSGQLTEEWRKSQKAEEWGFCKVGDFVERIEAGKSLKCYERPPVAGEYGIIKISAVTWGVYDEEESKTLPEKSLFLETRRIMPGDFLISRANTLELLGNPVIVGKVSKNLMLSDKVLRLVMPESYKQWLSIFLRSHSGRKEIEARSTGNQLSMRNIGQKELLDINLPKPGREEQAEIVRRVEQLFAFAGQLESKVQTAKTRIDLLTQSILAKAFRGELVTQDPSDEPASILLARIRAQRESQPKVRRGRKSAATN